MESDDKLLRKRARSEASKERKAVKEDVLRRRRAHEIIKELNNDPELRSIVVLGLSKDSSIAPAPPPSQEPF